MCTLLCNYECMFALQNQVSSYFCKSILSYISLGIATINVVDRR